jgi:predicted lactoylglutathione lyase
MHIKTIFLNLPVTDIARTRNFWTNLGFSFNENFSGEESLCLILIENQAYAMLINHDKFSTFTDKPIADGNSTEVLMSLQVDNKNDVDHLIRTAVENGGRKYKESTDLGWMYYDSFEDINGHQWEVMCIDQSKMSA